MKFGVYRLDPQAQLRSFLNFLRSLFTSYRSVEMEKKVHM